MPSENLVFQEVDTLHALSLDDLDALWELVPTQRQKHYADRLQREVRLQGAHGSDAGEQQVVQALLGKYQTEALVPVGARWVKAPQRVLQAARQGQALHAPEETLVTTSPRRQTLLLFGGGGLIFLCFLVFLVLKGGGTADKPTPTHDISLFSPTPRRTATPTPIALVESDTVIRDGDRDRALAYPIGLQILTSVHDQPRVFIVQRRRVELAEWQFDPNADTASFLSDLPVRMVLGIPYSRQNLTLFDDLDTHARFIVRMNTGGELRFALTSQQSVPRSDTQFFRQVEPGLTLVLIGETGSDGLPTGQRRVITAAYLAEHELARDGLLAEEVSLPDTMPTLLPVGSPTPLPSDPRAQLQVTLIEDGVTTQADAGLLTVRVRIYNGQPEAVTLGGGDFRVALGYAPQPPGPWLDASSLEPFTLLPGQAVDLTLVWPWSEEPFATLEMLAYKFGASLRS